MIQERKPCFFRGPRAEDVFKCHIFKVLEIESKAECLKGHDGSSWLWKCVMENVGGGN